MSNMSFKSRVARRRYAIESADAVVFSVQEAAVLAAAGNILERYLAKSKGPLMDSPRTVAQYLKLEYAPLQFEVFGVLWVDSRHRLIAHEQLFHGTIDGASVHPRRVVSSGLAHGAAAALCVHNHPSGQAAASQADIAISRRLKESLALVDLRLLDHLIVGHDTIYSMAEHGEL